MILSQAQCHSQAFCHSSSCLIVAVPSQAERKIPMNYASRYRNSALSQQSYLPFKVPSQLAFPCLFCDQISWKMLWKLPVLTLVILSIPRRSTT